MNKTFAALIAMLLGISFYISNQNNTYTTNSPALKHLKPADEYYLSRNFPYIGEGEQAYIRATNKAIAQRKKNRNGNALWNQEGPYNIGGRINTIAIHPTNNNIVYIGTPNTGIFKTIDGGTNWTHLFTEQTSLAIGALAIDPSNPNTIYAGTGDKALSSFTYLGNGLFKSTDGGNTWNYVGLNNTGVITKIAISPIDPNTIYVGTMGNIYTTNTHRGVYKTTDGGTTWTQVLFLGNDAGIGDMVMDYAHPDTVFVTGRNRFRSSLTSYIIGPAARIYRTHNGGVSWDTLSTGLPTGNQCKITLALSQSNPSLIYASYCDASLNYGGIYKSTNGGNSWTFLSADPNLNMGGFGWYFGEIRLDPNNNNVLYWMGINLFKSTNGGNSWNLAAPEWYTYDVHADKHDLQFISSSNFLLATDGGLYRTTTGGGTSASSWDYISNIPITQFYRVAYNPHDSLYYYGGAQDNGTQKGSNALGLSNWNRYFGGDGFQPAFDNDDANIFYTQTQLGNINATVDGGMNFGDITTSLTSTDRTNWNTPYVLSPHTPQTMFVGTYRVYKNSYSTTDSWTAISNDLTDGITSQHHTISALDISKLNAQVLYAGTSDANVWVTQNEGSTWTQINTGLPNRYVSSLKASPNNMANVFLSYWGYRDNDTTAYIYFSNNYGATWTSIANSTLPNFAINDIWVRPDGTDSSLIIATDGGVYATNSRGVLWYRVGTNMPILPVYDVEYNPQTKRVFVGTFGMSMQSIHIDSVFKPDQSTTVGVNNKSKISCTVFPNPCSSHVFVDLPQHSTAEIVLLNSSGLRLSKQICTSIRQRISLENYPSGIYFLQISTEGKQHIQKIYKQ